MNDKRDMACGSATSSLCPVSGLCGGCYYYDVPYEEELAEKGRGVMSLLKKEDVIPETFESIRACPEEMRFKYRNKMEYTFGDMEKGGELTLGMHRKKSYMSVLTCDSCRLVPEDYNRIVRATLDLALEKGYEKYNKKFHRGLLRNLVIRDGKRTGEILVNIVTTSESGFDEWEWEDRMFALPLTGKIAGVLHTLNDRPSDAVNADELRVLYGKPYYTEEILGLKFRVHAFAFFQTNVMAAERMYREALSLIDGFEGKTVFDLYCGTGTISQIAALKAERVIGVEIVTESVESAKKNAKLNGISNCEFRTGDVFRVLSESQEKPDVIIVDPPRAGITPEAVGKISSYQVPEILYISCNPKTLAVNLSQFGRSGYRTVYVRPYDNFPGTRNVETVALLKNDRK